MKSGDGSRDIVNNSAVPRRSSGKDEAALADWRAEHLVVPGTGHLRARAWPAHEEIGSARGNPQKLWISLWTI